MNQIKRIQDLVLSLPTNYCSEDLKLWLKAFFEVPAQVLKGEQKKDLLAVVKDFALALEDELNEVVYEDMEELFESQEVQKQRFKAILAAKCNKFINQIWKFQGELEAEIKTLQEDLENNRQSLQACSSIHIDLKSSEASGQQEMRRKGFEALRSSEKVLDSQQDWLEAVKEYPYNFSLQLGSFMSDKLLLLKKKEDLKFGIEWLYHGNSFGWATEETGSQLQLLEVIEIQYYLLEGKIFYFEVLSTTSDKFEKQGVQSLRSNEGDEEQKVKPRTLMLRRSEVSRVECSYSEDFQITFLAKDGSKLGEIKPGEGGQVYCQNVSPFFGIRTRHASNGLTTSIAIGRCRK